jgi:hypothetical protein
VLEIKVGAIEWYDESKSLFMSEGGIELQLEHSLVAVSKWEQKYEKPFLGKQAKDPNEVLDYVLCMVVGEIPRGDILEKVSERNLEEIQKYLNQKMTATWFRETGAPRTSEVITSELIYYWMTAFNIPWEAQHWHINRLFTLIRIANEKQAKPKKMGRQEAAARQRELNAQRRAQLGTKG